MPKPDPDCLTRRERQIMDVLYEHGQATAAVVRDGLSDPPSYSTIRALLAKLESKGHVVHHQDGPRYVFRPTVARQEARRSASQRLLRTFFEGSVTHAVSGLLDASEPSRAELDSLAALIEDARARKRNDR